MSTPNSFPTLLIFVVVYPYFLHVALDKDPLAVLTSVSRTRLFVIPNFLNESLLNPPLAEYFGTVVTSLGDETLSEIPYITNRFTCDVKHYAYLLYSRLCPPHLEHLAICWFHLAATL